MYPAEIPELATAVRVAGPAFTWIRDTRDSAMDAHRGTYTSFQEFLSAKAFGAQAEFNRIDTVELQLLRLRQGPLRAGAQHALRPGAGLRLGIQRADSAAGAALRRRAHFAARIFSQNAAGPRDPETGYPIGGAGALINSTELRLPPPTLPWFGNTLSFVLFHDMGNVFTNAGDAWPSALRIHQPDRDACKVLTPRGRLDQPALRRRGRPTSRPASRERAASTTSRTRRGLACATIRPSGPSVSISAIT